MPMELAVDADQPAAALEQRRFARRDESGVGGGKTILPHQFLGRRYEAEREAGVVRQQPPARHRRERHGDLELGIIAPAGPLERVGPGMIAHIFALRSEETRVGKESGSTSSSRWPPYH